MKIFLDTNVLPLNGTLDSFETTTLMALANEHGHSLVLPSIVLLEARAQRRIRAAEAYARLQQSVKIARGFGPIDIDRDLAVPAADESAMQFAKVLGQLFEIVELPPGAAEEALNRDALRVPPAHKAKAGSARDAAIWLTIKSVHMTSDACGFVTNNRDDFSDPTEATTLHPNLTAELGERAPLFRYYNSPAALVAALATPVECELNWEAIATSSPVQDAIVAAMTDRVASQPSLYQRTYRPTELAIQTSIGKARCYRLHSHVLAIVNSEWESYGEVTGWNELRGETFTYPVQLTMTAQLWLRLPSDGRGEPSFARVHSIESMTTGSLISVAELLPSTSEPRQMSNSVE